MTVDAVEIHPEELPIHEPPVVARRVGTAYGVTLEIRRTDDGIALVALPTVEGISVIVKSTMNNEIAERDAAISTVLARALSRHPRIDFSAMRQAFRPNTFDDTNWRMMLPERAHFQPVSPGFFARFIPGSGSRQARLQQDADAKYQEFKARYATYLEDNAAALRKHEDVERAQEDAISTHNEGVRRLEHSFLAGDHEAVVFCYDLLIKQSLDGEFDALSAEGACRKRSALTVH